MKRKNNEPLSTETTWALPQAVDMEKAVLGAILLEKEAQQEVIPLLRPYDFYLSNHQLIYQAIMQLHEQNHPVDMLTVTQELIRTGRLEEAGGAYEISVLVNGIASGVHADYHARIVLDKSRARQVIRMMDSILKRAYNEGEDIQEVIESLEQDLTGFMAGTSSFYSRDISEALREARLHAGKLQQLREEGKAVGVPTGNPTLDRIFGGGWMAPDMNMLGARPSMGKTQHALSFARAAAEAGKHVLFASLEMTDISLVNRWILEDEQINPLHLRSGSMLPSEWNAMEKQMGQLWNLPIHLASNHQIRYLNHLRSEARRLRRRNQLDLMIIDHLGLIRTGKTFASRYLEVGYITGELKSLAKELNIPVLLLCQLKRPQKGNAAMPPQLEDLRESGDIEQDADTVILLHKPDYYDVDATDSAGTPWTNRGKYIIAKYREGVRNSSIIFYHDPHYKKISDQPFPPPSPEEEE